MGQFSRRAFLQLSAATALPARPLFEIQKVAARTFIAIAEPAAILNCNSAIFVGSKGVLVVDTHSRPSAARALIAQIREEVSPLPVTDVVVSHFHYDHSQGTAAFAELSPPPRIHSTGGNLTALRKHGALRVEEAVAAAKRKPENAELREFAAEMSGYRPVLPDKVFERRTVVQLGNREVELFVPGRGHTGSDICAWCPRARVLAAADLVVGFVPGMNDGYPLEWPETLDVIDATPFEILLPGHGPVHRGHERLRQQKAYFEELIDRTRKIWSANATLAEAQAQLTPESLQSYADGGYRDFVAAATRRYRPIDPDHVEDAMRTAIAGNVAAIWKALGG